MKILNRTNPLCLRFIPKREWVSAVLFAVCAWLFMLVMTFRYTTLNDVDKDLYKLLLRIAWIIINVSVINFLFLTDYRIKDMLFILFFWGILVYAITMRSPSACHDAVAGIMLAASGKHFNKKLFFKVTTFVFLAIVLSVVICNLAGILPSHGFVRDDGRMRYDFGFIHPNRVGTCAFTFCSYWLIWRYDRLKWFDYLLFIAAAVFCWLVPNSRTAVVIMLAFPAAVLFVKVLGPKIFGSRIGCILAFLLHPFFFALSLFLGYAYDGTKKIFLLADQVASRRIWYAHHFLTTTRFSYWGRKLKTVPIRVAERKGSSALVLDNNYVRLFLGGGLVPALSFFLLLSILIYVLARRKQYPLVVIMALFALYACFENRLLRITYNLALFALPMLFTPESICGEKEEKTGRGSGPPA